MCFFERRSWSRNTPIWCSDQDIPSIASYIPPEYNGTDSCTFTAWKVVMTHYDFDSEGEAEDMQ